MATVRVDQILIRDLMQHLEQKGANWKKHQNTYSYLKTFDHQSYYRLIQKHESSLKIKMKKKALVTKKIRKGGTKLYIITSCKVIINEVIINNPANIYLFKVNNKNTRKRCEICSKLTIKTSKLWYFGKFNFEKLCL